MTQHPYAVGDKVRVLQPDWCIATRGDRPAVFVPPGTRITGVVEFVHRDGSLCIDTDKLGKIAICPSQVELITAAPTQASLEADLVAALLRQDRAWYAAATAKRTLNEFREANQPAPFPVDSPSTRYRTVPDIELARLWHQDHFWPVANEMARRLTDKETAQ